MSFDRIVGRAVERFDAEVLFDPFEEQLYLPATPIKFGNREGGECKIVGQKDEGLVACRIVILDAPQVVGVGPTGIKPREPNGLIAPEPRLLVDGVGIEPAALEVGLGPDNKEGGALSEHRQSGEVEIPTIHDVEGAGLWEQFVEHLDIGQLAVGDMNERGDVASQIEERMELDRRFGLAEVGPRRACQVFCVTDRELLFR